MLAEGLRDKFDMDPDVEIARASLAEIKPFPYPCLAGSLTLNSGLSPCRRAAAGDRRTHACRREGMLVLGGRKASTYSRRLWNGSRAREASGCAEVHSRHARGCSVRAKQSPSQPTQPARLTVAVKGEARRGPGRCSSSLSLPTRPAPTTCAAPEWIRQASSLSRRTRRCFRPDAVKS